MSKVATFWGLNSNAPSAVLSLFQVIYNGLKKTTNITIDDYNTIDDVLNAVKSDEKSIALLWLKAKGNDFVIRELSCVDWSNDNPTDLNCLQSRINCHIESGYSEFLMPEIVDVFKDINCILEGQLQNEGAFKIEFLSESEWRYLDNCEEQTSVCSFFLLLT